jgi:protein-tyrosine kinase
VSLIEKAARRLEELKRAGVATPETSSVQRVRRPAAYRSDSAVQGAAPPLADGALRVARDGFLPSGKDSPFIVPGPARTSKSVEIDLARLASNGFLIPDTPRSALANELRLIKRPLLANAKGRSTAPIRRSNLVMVTSSLPGEGKTFTSINLAISIAMELDSTVLLVDADVARPAILDRLGLPQAPGLLDALTSEPDLSDLLLKTNIERLSILPAGTPHGRATELLASEGMSRLLDELASRYADRIVIFDAPPVLVSTESRALATQVGQVVLIVEADRTNQGAVRQTLTMLEACPVLMTVLNKVSGSDGSEYYGSYGGYGDNGE